MSNLPFVLDQIKLIKMLKNLGRASIVLSIFLLGLVLCHGHSGHSHSHSNHAGEDLKKKGGLGSVIKGLMDQYGLDTV
jgi:hypothetical protein